jgi:hypothetical protein
LNEYQAKYSLSLLNTASLEGFLSISLLFLSIF